MLLTALLVGTLLLSGLVTASPAYAAGNGSQKAANRISKDKWTRAEPAAHASDRVVIWGHSQGGHAALWAGQIAASYAPDLSITGAVAGGVP